VGELLLVSPALTRNFSHASRKQTVQQKPVEGVLLLSVQLLQLRRIALSRGVCFRERVDDSVDRMIAENRHDLCAAIRAIVAAVPPLEVARRTKVVKARDKRNTLVQDVRTDPAGDLQQGRWQTSGNRLWPSS